jgi:hypothetical protein
VSPSFGDLVKGVAVTKVLDRLGAEPQERSGRRRRQARAADRRAERTPALMAMLALGLVALVTMLVFEHTITRVVGVLCLFGFIVAGVFAIATPEFLEEEQ